MQEKIDKTHKEITHIQNTIWAIYKSFLEDHDIKEYDRKMAELMEEYRIKKDEALFSFCKCQFISWEHMIRGFAEMFRQQRD